MPHDAAGGPAPPAGSADRGLASVLAAARARLPRPAPRRRRTTGARIAVAAGVVALLLLVALFAGHAGVRSGGGTSPGTTPAATASSFYSALGPANAAARALYWNWPANDEPPLVFAEGLASPRALGAIVSSSHLGAKGCAPTLLTSSAPTLPAYAGIPTNGTATAWLFAFQASGNTLLVVAVINGTATIVASTPLPGGCYTGPGTFSAVVVDSTVAAATAAGTGLSLGFFSAARANTTVVSTVLRLVPPGFVPGTPPAPMWTVNDTVCPLYGTPTVKGAALLSVVNAASGALVSQSSSTVTC